MELLESFVRETASFVSHLRTADKLTVIGLFLTVFLSFFPWKVTVADDEVLGIDFRHMGFPVVLFAALGIASLVVRERDLLPGLTLRTVWLAQLGSVIATVLWALAYILKSWDARMVPSPVGNFEMAASRPAFSVYVALITGVVALGGSVSAYRERSA